MYRIGEAARQVGVSPSALRLWERQGLIHPERTRGRYRIYSDTDLALLREVRRLRSVDQLNAAGIRRVLRRVAADPHPLERGFYGRVLRRLRRDRGMSLSTASRRSGLSVSFLSALERGLSGASVSTLQRLMVTYGATMLELFGASRSRGRARLVKADDREILRIADGAVRIEQLATGSRHLEPQLFVLAPGATSDGAYAHDGEEFIYLLSGSVTVELADDERYRLRQPGDALTFPSTVPHRWRNDASGETRLLWINTPPTF